MRSTCQLTLYGDMTLILRIDIQQLRLSA